MWWGGVAQNGWGISVLEQYEKLFSVWFTYGEDGSPTWFVMPDGVDRAGHLRGRLYRTTGSPGAGATYDRAASWRRMPGHIACFSGDSATFDYSTGDRSGTLPLVRQHSGRFRTECHPRNRRTCRPPSPLGLARRARDSPRSRRRESRAALPALPPPMPWREPSICIWLATISVVALVLPSFLPLAGLQAPLDVHLAALLEVFAGDLGQLAEEGDAVPFGLLLLPPLLSFQLSSVVATEMLVIAPSSGM